MVVLSLALLVGFVVSLTSADKVSGCLAVTVGLTVTVWAFANELTLLKLAANSNYMYMNRSVIVSYQQKQH